jgi:hypothetical protein
VLGKIEAVLDEEMIGWAVDDRATRTSGLTLRRGSDARLAQGEGAALPRGRAGVGAETGTHMTEPPAAVARHMFLRLGAGGAT